jgi:hypothetical protein
MKIILNVSSKRFQKYSSEVDTSIGLSVSSKWLIQNYKKSDKTLCLQECNLNDGCYTATYSSDFNLLDNCILYSKYFATSELILLNNTTLYSKECK